MLGGVTLAAALLIGYVGYWTNWFGLTAPDSPPAQPAGPGGPSGSPAGHATVGSWVVLAVFAALVVASLVWIWRGLRDERPDLDELPVAEQERRRQAAALLRQVEPPVSEAEARAALRPAWLEEASRRAAERSHDTAAGNGQSGS